MQNDHNEPPAYDGPDPLLEELEEAAPYPASRWFFDLLFRPGRFFAHVPGMHWPTLTALCFLVFGVSGGVERMERQMMRGNNQLANGLAQSWEAYWAFVLIVGAFSALVYYAIGGWWYGVRVGWSGGDATDKRAVRRVYVFAAMITAVPTIAVTIAETISYATPEEAYTFADSWFYVALLIFPFWSAWASFRGVRTAFGVRRVSGAVWFLILPSLMYAVAFGGIVMALTMSPPHTGSPVTYRAQQFEFDMPRNWSVDVSAVGHDPESYVWIDTGMLNALNVQVYRSDDSPEAELAITLADFARDAMETWDPIERWGPHEGAGRRGTARVWGGTQDVAVFVSRGPDDWMVEWLIIVEPGDVDDEAPGVNLMIESFRWK